MKHHKAEYERYKEMLKTWKILVEKSIPHNSEIEQIEKICEAHCVSYDEILAKKQKKEFIIAKIAITEHFKQKWYTYERIGMLLNCHHASIMYLYKKYWKWKNQK